MSPCDDEHRHKKRACQDVLAGTLASSPDDSSDRSEPLPCAVSNSRDLFLPSPEPSASVFQLSPPVLPDCQLVSGQHQSTVLHSPNLHHVQDPVSEQDLPVSAEVQTHSSHHESDGTAEIPKHHSPKVETPPAADPLLKPFIIELFAGSARVTSFLQALGLKDSFGVDHKVQKNAGRTLIADLTTHEGQVLCRTWLSSPNLAGVFAAPPCGTCSAARGIPIKLPSGRTIKGPQPLRDKYHPNGLSGLSWLARCRVSQANRLYHFLSDIILDCISRNLIVCIEESTTIAVLAHQLFPQDSQTPQVLRASGMLLRV